jgi:tetratricopeptide (TPR) repeat protein
VDVLVAQAYAAKYSNQPAQAVTKAMEALPLARERAQSDPSDKNAQIQLGAALQCAAVVGNPKNALPYFEEQATLYDKILAREPGNLNLRRNTALANKYVAGYLLTSGDLDRAFPHLQRAEDLDQSVVHAAPNNPESKMDLAIDLSQWAEYYEGKNDFGKAIQYARASLQIRRELAAADPKDTRTRDKLSYILNRLGNIQLHVSAADALASYREAKSIAEQLPTESVRSQRLAIAISGMGNAYRALGDAQHSCLAYAESLKFFRQSLASSPANTEPAEETEKAYSHCPGAN